MCAIMQSFDCVQALDKLFNPCFPIPLWIHSPTVITTFVDESRKQDPFGKWAVVKTGQSSRLEETISGVLYISYNKWLQ